MLASELRQKYIDFFVQKHKHVEIQGAPVVPENDPTVLFTTAGMHPLVPYLMGEKHPMGNRLVDCQKCIRTDDIEEVGDATHCTFFEMLGNWSLGDYFKEGAIAMSMEFLVEELKIDPKKLYVTVFEGDDDAPQDSESIEIWKKQFAKYGIEAGLGTRIFAYGKKENWWGPAGQTGPCGPCTEMFFYTGEGEANISETCHPAVDDTFVEVWNDVLMEYNKNADGSFTPLQQKNVDTGLGLERVTAILQGKESHYETELFSSTIEAIHAKAQESNTESERIIADHMRAAVFMISDNVIPGNVDQGYVLRRLIRRAIRHGNKLGIEGSFVTDIAEKIIETYKNPYQELVEKKEVIIEELRKEEEKFSETVKQGEKEFLKIIPNVLKSENKILSGRLAFKLYDTYGFPVEMTEELATEHGITIDKKGFDEAYEKHQELSRQGAEQKFKGGLADHSEKTTALHTATHLLHKALRMVLGEHVEQRGSNITHERLRFDFSHPDKMTPEQIKQVEDIVNEQIQKDLDIWWEETTVEEAKEAGAIGLFEHKYGEKVKMYTMGNKDSGEFFSREICGGPHVEKTSSLKSFKIKKEQSSSGGVRRIKAVIGIE